MSLLFRPLYDPFEDPFFSPAVPSHFLLTNGSSPSPVERAHQQALSRRPGHAFWDWNHVLKEPISMGLQDLNDRYEMNLRRPKEIPDDQLKVETKDGFLTVSGQHQQENKSADGNSYTSSYSSFSRSVKLPDNVEVENIAANYTDDGVVRIELPKKQPLLAPSNVKQIPITKKNQLKQPEPSNE